MEIKKTVITAAGHNQRTLPLQTLVDRDGQTKSALAIIVEESLQAGIEEICVVISPGDQAAYCAAAGPHGRRVEIRRANPAARLRPRRLVRAGVHRRLAVPAAGRRSPLRQPSREALRAATGRNGAPPKPAPSPPCRPRTKASCLITARSGGRLAGARKGLYEVSDVMEKPTPTEAEQKLIVPGLRAGHYLCFFGMHVLTPAVMELLGEEMAAAGESGRRASEPGAVAARGARALSGLRAGGPPLRHRRAIRPAHRPTGAGLDGKDRDEVLTGLVELLALGGK